MSGNATFAPKEAAQSEGCVSRAALGASLAAEKPRIARGVRQNTPRINKGAKIHTLLCTAQLQARAAHPEGCVAPSVPSCEGAARPGGCSLERKLGGYARGDATEGTSLNPIDVHERAPARAAVPGDGVNPDAFWRGFRAKGSCRTLRVRCLTPTTCGVRHTQALGAASARLCDNKKGAHNPKGASTPKHGAARTTNSVRTRNKRDPKCASPRNPDAPPERKRALKLRGAQPEGCVEPGTRGGAHNQKCAHDRGARPKGCFTQKPNTPNEIKWTPESGRTT